jgi:phage baseplate assembly protein W
MATPIPTPISTRPTTFRSPTVSSRNPTTSRQQRVPAWYGPILSRNTYLGQPLALVDPNVTPPISRPGPIFPSPMTYREALTSSINMLFGTRPGERLWLPTYGLNMDALVFEVLDSKTTATAQQTIRSVIEAWEPRVAVDAVNIGPLPNSNQFIIQIVFRILGSTPDDIFTYSYSYTPPA